MEVSGQLKASANILSDKNLGTWMGGWVDLRAGLVIFEKRWIPFAYMKAKLGPFSL